MNQRPLQVHPGDIIVQRKENGTWATIKILQVDAFSDGTSTAHCMSYAPAHSKPTAASVLKLEVQIWHAPILASSFGDGWECIANQPVPNAELAGFVEYLKLTDFPRYVCFTGRDLEEIVRAANEHYNRGHSLGEQGKQVEAIAEYSRAIEMFPLFYEAIDNRASAFMELGDYAEALADFEQSLRVNANGMAALFSKGECLLRLGRASAAEAIFSEGLTRFPEQSTMFKKYLEFARSMQRGG